ncbi:hypothetical protein, partial [Serratia grimesii]|uniref:hypothetical protein n=1 Tax=Serratia grimesii TaxID=82995 RepID=UPI0022402975
LFTSTVPTNRSRYSVIAMPKKIKAAYYRESAAGRQHMNRRGIAFFGENLHKPPDKTCCNRL